MQLPGEGACGVEPAPVGVSRDLERSASRGAVGSRVIRPARLAKQVPLLDGPLHLPDLLVTIGWGLPG